MLKRLPEHISRSGNSSTWLFEESWTLKRTLLLIISTLNTFLANVAQFQDIGIFLEAVVICKQSKDLNSSTSLSSPGIFLKDSINIHKNVWFFWRFQLISKGIPYPNPKKTVKISEVHKLIHIQDDQQTNYFLRQDLDLEAVNCDLWIEQWFGLLFLFIFTWNFFEDFTDTDKIHRNERFFWRLGYGKKQGR